MANAAYGVWTPQSCARCSRRGVLWLMQRMVSGPHSLVLGVVGEEYCG